MTLAAGFNWRQPHVQYGHKVIANGVPGVFGGEARTGLPIVVYDAPRAHYGAMHRDKSTGLWVSPPPIVVEAETVPPCSLVDGEPLND